MSQRIYNDENTYKNMEHDNEDEMNNLNSKEVVGSINYMYPQTNTGYNTHYDINAHMTLENEKNKKKYENEKPIEIKSKHNKKDSSKKIEKEDNKIKELVDEITDNIDKIDSMDNIYEFYESTEKKEQNENNWNMKGVFKYEKWKDSILIFVIYILMSLPSVQLFIGKYIKMIVPNPSTCNVSMMGAVIYGGIMTIIFFVIKNKLIFEY